MSPDQLPTDLRQLLVLRLIDGLSCKKIADAWGISEREVLERQHRALSLLRASLARRGGPS